jgi:predicted hydrocarbon binding protein
MSEDRKTDNFTMRITLETLETIIGNNGLKSILNHSGLYLYIDNFPPDDDMLEIPLDDIHSLHSSLRELFGNNGVRSLQLQIGQEICRIGLEKRTGIVRALRLGAKLLPESQKMRMTLEKYMEQAETRQPPSNGTSRFMLHEYDDFFELTDRDYHMSRGITSEWPVCNDIVGTLFYLMKWVTGHSHEVEEIKCRAMGHPADVFRIYKHYMD